MIFNGYLDLLMKDLITDQIMMNYVDGYKVNYYQQNPNQNERIVLIQIGYNHNHHLFKIFEVEGE